MERSAFSISANDIAASEMDSNDFQFEGYGLNIEAILRALLKFFGGGASGGQGGVDGLIATFWSIWHIYSVLAFLASALLLFGIIYAKIRTAELEKHHHHILHHAEEEYAHSQSHVSKNQRWEDALLHAESENPNDWRLAIIEADIMLESLLTSLGYAGLTIGDKLKQASPQFFKTIDDAWQAHKVRNDIAHRGSDFVLTKRLAKDTLERYRRVFHEFDIV